MHFRSTESGLPVYGVDTPVYRRLTFDLQEVDIRSTAIHITIRTGKGSRELQIPFLQIGITGNYSVLRLGKIGHKLH